MKFCITNYVDIKKILYSILALFLIVRIYAGYSDNDNRCQENKAIELAFKVTDAQLEVYKNSIAINALYASWMMHAYAFMYYMYGDSRITIKNALIAFINGAWLGISCSWHEYLVANRELLLKKHKFYKEAIEEIGLAQQQLSEQPRIAVEVTQAGL